MENKEKVWSLGERQEFLNSLERCLPWIPWRQAIHMTNFSDGTQGFGCRICIAKFGIKGEQIKFLPATLGGHADHLVAYHGIGGEANESGR